MKRGLRKAPTGKQIVRLACGVKMLTSQWLKYSRAIVPGLPVDDEDMTTSLRKAENTKLMR